MRQSHLFENGKSRTDMLPARTRHVARDRSGRSHGHHEGRSWVRYRLCTAGNRPIQRGEALLPDFAPFSFDGIKFGPVTELPGTQVFCNGSNSMLYILAVETDCLVVSAQASQGDVGMGVFGVVVGNGDPFERHAQIRLHPLHEIARQAAEINPIAEFR